MARDSVLLLALWAGLTIQGAELHLILGTTNANGADQFDAAIAVVKGDGAVKIKKALFGPRSSNFEGLGWIDTNYDRVVMNEQGRW
jgi:hypothetical protein